MQFSVFLAISLLSSSACSKPEEKSPAPESASTKKPDVEPETKPEAAADSPSTTESSLNIGESKIMLGSEDSGAETVITIMADGKIMVGEEELAVLEASGEMRINGKLVSTLAKDGTLSFAKRNGTMNISENGEVTNNGEVICIWNEDGTLGGAAAKHTHLKPRYEGAPEHRRVASYALLAGMMIADGSPESAWLGESTEDTAQPQVAPAANP